MIVQRTQELKKGALKQLPSVFLTLWFFLNYNLIDYYYVYFPHLKQIHFTIYILQLILGEKLGL